MTWTLPWTFFSLFCTVACTVCSVEFEMGGGRGDGMGSLVSSALRRAARRDGASSWPGRTAHQSKYTGRRGAGEIRAGRRREKQAGGSRNARSGWRRRVARSAIGWTTSDALNCSGSHRPRARVTARSRRNLLTMLLALYTHVVMSERMGMRVMLTNGKAISSGYTLFLKF